MIYTLTLNPAIDYVVNVENYVSGAVNRTFGAKLLAGGKGINVSTVLKNLGAETVAMGFLAGFTGELIKKMLDGDGIQNDFIFAENESANNFFTISNSGVNGPAKYLYIHRVDLKYE